MRLIVWMHDASSEGRAAIGRRKEQHRIMEQWTTGTIRSRGERRNKHKRRSRGVTALVLDTTSALVLRHLSGGLLAYLLA